MAHAILDPTGRGVTPTSAAAAGLAPRSDTLEGLRIGLLDNTKHNALQFLQDVGNMLVSDYGADSVSIVETKENFSVPVDDAIVTRFKDSADVVITGVGDCGSCSAAAVADGINFERAGVPAAVVVTDAFLATGKMMAEVQGAPDYEWITTEHPMASLSTDDVTERARSLAPQIAAAVSKATS